jgi:hypothetical protein
MTMLSSVYQRLVIHRTEDSIRPPRQGKLESWFIGESWFIRLYRNSFNIQLFQSVAARYKEQRVLSPVIAVTLLFTFSTDILRSSLQKKKENMLHDPSTPRRSFPRTFLALHPAVISRWRIFRCFPV